MNYGKKSSIEFNKYLTRLAEIKKVSLYDLKSFLAQDHTSFLSMEKLPKNHPVIIELEREIELARRNVKKFRTTIANHLQTIFDKQLAKHKDKTEKLIKELEVIASQKQDYAK